MRVGAKQPRLRLARSLAVAMLTMVGTLANAADAVGRDGDWELRIEPGSVAGGFDLCVLRTTNEIEGGRRERARVSVVLGGKRVTVDPDRYLSGVVTAIAALESRSDRAQPIRVLEHRMQIDDGEALVGAERDPRFGDWQAGRVIQDFGAFLEAMSAGTTLHYEWRLERSQKTHAFRLAGFRSLLEVARSDPRCGAGG